MTSLFAAFNIADGTVISELHRQHRAVEFKKFLVAIDKAVPDELDVHLVCDNLATHKTPAIRDWLERHPGSACISPHRLVVDQPGGTLVRVLTDQMIRRGVHKSVQALERTSGHDRDLERESQAVRVDKDGRGDPRFPSEIYR